MIKAEKALEKAYDDVLACITFLKGCTQHTSNVFNFFHSGGGVDIFKNHILPKTIKYKI
jgi:hypothetical protein